LQNQEVLPPETNMAFTPLLFMRCYSHGQRKHGRWESMTNFLREVLCFQLETHIQTEQNGRYMLESKLSLRQSY